MFGSSLLFPRVLSVKLKKYEVIAQNLKLVKLWNIVIVTKVTKKILEVIDRIEIIANTKVPMDT